MSDRKTKYIWEGWESSGKEPWVFSVEEPCELIGVHAELIDNELNGSENIEYCIYSPRFCSATTPFRVEVEEASYGVCVTDKRFIISKDRHRKDTPPSITTVEFRQVIYISIGKSLLMGWFSIRYVEAGKIKNITVLFNATGMHHFEKLLLIFRKRTGSLYEKNMFPATRDVRHYLSHIPGVIEVDAVARVTGEDEYLIMAFPCMYLWNRFKRRRIFSKREEDCYITSRATVVLTDKVLSLIRRSESFSGGENVDIMNIPLEKLGSVVYRREKMPDCTIYNFIIRFIKDVGEDILVIPLAAFHNDLDSSGFRLYSLLMCAGRGYSIES